MNILFINLSDYSDKLSTQENSKTSESIQKNLTAKDSECSLSIEDIDINHHYYKLLDLIPKKKLKACDYICLIPEGSIITDNYRTIIEEYVNKDEQAIYLPLGLVVANDSKRGMFNTILWSNQCIEPGVLDHELALKQTDTVLFGALIPKDLFFDETYYAKELKFYQHYYLLNRWSKLDNVKIYGIPKLLVELDYDLSYNKFNKEEKIANYKLANEEFKVQNV